LETHTIVFKQFLKFLLPIWQLREFPFCDYGVVAIRVSFDAVFAAILDADCFSPQFIRVWNWGTVDLAAVVGRRVQNDGKGAVEC
jgi:hypothetical protein